MTDLVIKEYDDGVLTLTMNVPKKKNAFAKAMLVELIAALNDANQDHTVACVILAGAEGNFSSGADLTEFGGGGDGSDGEEQIAAHPFAQLCKTVVDFEKPLIGAAQGIAVGGGATLLFHCDVVYVGESLRMRLPFANLGVVPEFASSYTLAANIGSRQAAELMYTAEWINAERAVDVGIATRAYPDEQLMAKAKAKAQEIAQWPISGLVATKQLMQAPHKAAIMAALEAEEKAMLNRAGSPENIEAIVAFLEKREPNFRQFRK